MTLILIDVSNLLFRSHYANRHLTRDGVPTGATHGFLRTIGCLRAEFPKCELAFCWDYGLPGDRKWITPWRVNLFPEYKGNRTDDVEKQRVRSQMQDLYGLLTALGWPQYGVPGLEADDLMSIIANQSVDKSVLLYTGDRDVYQVLDDLIMVLVPKKDGQRHKLFGWKELEAQENLAASQWATYLALGGDKSDHIHVLPKVGPVTAKKMIACGIRLEHSFAWDDQPVDVKKRWPVCKDLWCKLQAAFTVARLPRTGMDSRIFRYVPEPWRSPGFYFDEKCRKAADAGARLKQFCVDRGLAEVLAKQEALLQ